MQPRCAVIHAWLAYAYTFGGPTHDPAKALLEARTSISLDKLYSGGYLGESSALEENGDLAGAYAAYKMAVSLFPPGPTLPQDMTLELEHLRKMAGSEPRAGVPGLRPSAGAPSVKSDKSSHEPSPMRAGVDGIRFGWQTRLRREQ